MAGDTGVAEVLTDPGALLAAYRNQAWDEALGAMDPLAGMQMDLLDVEGCLHLYRERIEDFGNDQPPADRDGTFMSETK